MNTVPADTATARVPAAPAEAREPNRRLQFLSENFPEGVIYQYTVTADGRGLLTYLGRGAERIFGERPNQIPVDVGWLTARILPEDEPGIAKAGECSRRNLTRFAHDVRILASDGSERWVSFRTQPREMEDGSVVWDGVIIETTERHRAEEAVRRRSEFLGALNRTTLELLGRRQVPDLLHALTQRAAALLRSSRAEIALLDGDELVVRAYSLGVEGGEGERSTREQAAISWRAIDQREAVVVDHSYDTPETRRVHVGRHIQTAAIFPILHNEKCVGVLRLERDEPGQAFLGQDLEEGILLAQMATLVLQNAALHEEAEREAEARTAALRESEARFRAVFDRSPILFELVSLPDTRIIELNSAALNAFGYTRDGAIGRTLLELGNWVNPERRRHYFELLDQEGTVSNFEAEMRRKSGETFTVIHSGARILIGAQSYGLSSQQDITERKQSEAARDRMLALMRATLESTADGILVVNGEGRIETYNRNFAEMWGLPVHNETEPPDEEALLRTLLDQLEEPERFLASVRDVYSESEDEIYDVLHGKDGRVFERFSRPQVLATRPAGRVWSFRDTTDQRRHETALRESEERFRVLADVSPVGIFSSNPAGQTVFVNRRWCEIAGLTDEEAMGDGWKRALHPDDFEGVARNWEEAVRNGESSAAEFRFVRPDGTVRWLVGQSRAQFHSDDRLAGYVGTITDVTNLKRAEDARKRLEAETRQSRKMESLGTLAGGIAHDFNNILTGTFGFLDLARLELPRGHPAHAWLDRIGTSSERARELVRQILTFSRKNDGERNSQQIHAVVGEALRLLRSTLPPMVLLETQIATDAPSVMSDATQIHQVILNLCTNAWHALPSKGGKIKVCLEACTVSGEQAASLPDLRVGPAVRLSVSDNGCGMDAATLDHIYEPFFTTKGTGAGTGLGLAVVHGIVKSHDGAIVVHSAVGVGTTFEVYFPETTAALQTAAITLPQLPRGRGQRILVVDDDAVSGFAIEKMVESVGYVVKRFIRPETALAHFGDSPREYDLVVSDLAMPGMNGAELIEHLLRIRPDLPVIIVTGFIETARQKILEKSAARAVLRKPVSRDELARAIALHLPKKR